MNKLDLIIDALTNRLFRDDPDAQRVTIDITVTGEGYSRSSGITRDRPEPDPVIASEPISEPLPEPAPVIDQFDNLSDPDYVEPPDVISEEAPLEDAVPQPKRTIERKRGVRLYRSQVREIKLLLKTSKIHQNEIAARYGVSPALISHIYNGRTWKNV